MKNEAIQRMEITGLYPKVIDEFRDENKLNLSDNGWLFWLSEDYQKRVNAFEAETGNLVYHVIETNTTLGKMLSLLYVSSCPDEWDEDRADLKNCCPLVYVINLDDEYCSEFGSIIIRNLFGGLVRTV